MKEIIDNRLGKVFPPATVFAGYVFILVGLYAVIEPVLGLFVLNVNLLFAILCVPIGVFVSFSIIGVQLNPEKKEYRKYYRLFDFVQGTWKSYENYPYLAILRKKVGSTAYSMSNRAASTSDELYYDICLLNSTHRKKKIIKRLKGAEEAKKEARILAEQLQVEYTMYSPKVSRRTRARRNR